MKPAPRRITILNLYCSDFGSDYIIEEDVIDQLVDRKNFYPLRQVIGQHLKDFRSRCIFVDPKMNQANHMIYLNIAVEDYDRYAGPVFGPPVLVGDFLNNGDSAYELLTTLRSEPWTQKKRPPIMVAFPFL